jgi:hypothetical protein
VPAPPSVGDRGRGCGAGTCVLTDCWSRGRGARGCAVDRR